MDPLKVVRSGAKPMAERILASKNRCRWMDAGVLQLKFCDNDYDCVSCEFDRVMTESAVKLLARQLAGKAAAQKEKAAPWEKKMQQRFGERRQCPLMKTNLCHQCSFDELLEEQFDFFLAPPKPRVHEIFGIQVPTSNFLHRGHTWVALESADRVRLGLDDFSHKLLGPFTRIDFPKIGQKVRANEPFMSLGRQRKKAEVLAPLDGTIEAINPKVLGKPQIAHDDPYGDGWLFIVAPTNLKGDLQEMLFGQCNIAWTESELIKLMGMMQAAPGVVLPSGGALMNDVYGNYLQLGWRRLVHEFLHTA